MGFFFSSKIIRAVVPEPCIFFWILASNAGVAPVIANVVKIFLSVEMLLLLMDLLFEVIKNLKKHQTELL